MTALNTISPFIAFHRIAVVGAAGKMGTGISLLLLQEMALCRLQRAAQKNSQEHFRLMLIDSSRQGLEGLRKYLVSQIQRFAEKNIIVLRKAAADIPSLISNREIIDFFLDGAIEIVQFVSSIEEAKDAQLIFEAIVEDIEGKAALLAALKKQSSENPYFFSNTSSIPLSVLNAKGGLNGRIIGFHFYNPPAVQKLLEIIPLEDGDPELKLLAVELAKKLNKHVVFSKDVAGFIGNGYFLHEIAFACTLAQNLATKHGLVQSVYIINKVTQEFLLRPMGIFQLIDYVGLDVVARVGEILNRYQKNPFYSNDLLAPLLKAGHSGGQFSDGSQKDGFFQYANQKITAIFDPEANGYCSLETAEWKQACDTWVGSPPGKLSWKALSNSADSHEQIQSYFIQLQDESSEGAKMACVFLQNLQDIVRQLVNDGIAANSDDVATVLKKGFYHLYDPVRVVPRETITKVIA